MGADHHQEVSVQPATNKPKQASKLNNQRNHHLRNSLGAHHMPGKREAHFTSTDILKDKALFIILQVTKQSKRAEMLARSHTTTKLNLDQHWAGCKLHAPQSLPYLPSRVFARLAFPLLLPTEIASQIGPF